jgi:hypothetical protein
MPGSIIFQYHFNDNSGTNLNDYSLYNNDATLTTDGSGAWSSNIPFDISSNAYANSPNSFKFNGGDYFKYDVSSNWSGSFTLSMWVKPTETMDGGIFASTDASSISNSFQIDSNGSGRWNIRSNHTSGGVVYDFADISLNTWQHIAVSWNYDEIYTNRVLKLYFNGVLVKTIVHDSTPTLPTDLNYFFDVYKIGSNRNTDNLFKGYITSTLLYDNALLDIYSLYNYNTDPSGSIHVDISDCPTFTPTNQHIFVPVYLDNNKIIIDSSQNASSTLDASYNFVMNANYTKAEYLRLFLKYKKNTNDYTFKFNESYKILFEQALKNDIENTPISIYDSSFNTGIDPGEASIGRMFVRYISDALMGHPFAQAFIANESEIISTVINSNLHLQLSLSLKDNLTTNSYNTNEICKSVIIQFVDDSPDRFFNEAEDTEYNFPFCEGDYISLYVRMNCEINLHEIGGQSCTFGNNDLSGVGQGASASVNIYQILKNIYGNKTETIFNDTTETMKIVEKTWRVKICLK